MNHGTTNGPAMNVGMQPPSDPVSKGWGEGAAHIRCLGGLRRCGAVVLACLVAGLPGCARNDKDSTMPSTTTSLTRADWNATASRTIFFGHQSVGDNILDGVKQIEAAEGWPALRVLALNESQAARLNGPALAHLKIGVNGEPLSKIKAFRAALDAGIGDQVNVALMKFCFWDIRSDTDVDAVFAEYRAAMADLAGRFPRVTFIHATVPLVAADVDWRARVRRLVRVGTPTDADNRTRETLNRRIREQYGRDGIVLDIALSEAGTGGLADPPQLASEFTSDGAHLNEAGRRNVGAAFVKALARAAGRQTQ